MPGPWKTSIIIAVSLDALKLQRMYVEAFNWALPKSGWLSAVYLRIWLTGSKIIHACWISFAGKGQQFFKIRPVNLKSETPRMSLKRVPADVKLSNCRKPQHLYLQRQKISTKTAIFMATKHEKTNLAVV